MDWVVFAPMFIGIVLGQFFRTRAIDRASQRSRAWWLGWAAGRHIYTPEGWRDQMRALWVPVIGCALTLIWALVRALES